MLRAAHFRNTVGVGRGQHLADRLLSVVREELGLPVEYSQAPTALSGGAFSANYLFQLDRAPKEWSDQLVLRLVPGSSVQVRVEAAVQAGAHAAGVPAPPVLTVQTNESLLGAPFMIMRLLPGRGFLRGIEWHRFVRDYPKMLRAWPAMFRQTLALLDRADPAPVFAELARQGVPEDLGLTTRHLTGIDRELGGDASFQEGVAWLHDNKPPLPARLRIVHGDLWPANVLMSHGTVCGLVDWTMGAVGDPALDVGFAKVGLALMPEPFPPPPPVRNIIHRNGTRLARQIHERCAPHGDDGRIAYFEALRCMVQLSAVHADRRADIRNGWEHGVPALITHFNNITGLDIATARPAM